MTFRQVQNQRYESALEVRVSILADEITTLRGFVKELMLVVDHLRQKVDSVPGEEEIKQKTERERDSREREEKEREEREREEKERERGKKKSKFYSILSMAGIFSVIGAGILWRKM